MKGETAKSGFQASCLEASCSHSFRQLPSRNTLLNAFTLAITVIGVTFALSGIARAGDDDDDPPEQGIVGKLMQGISGQSMDEGKINYRERSPLVVPRTTDLPPPVPKKTKFGTNWPKDPDEQARREAAEAAKAGPVDPIMASRPVMPSELAIRKPRGKDDGKPEPALPYVNNILSPSQLGYTGGLFGMFGKKEEKTTFKEEPKREELTQPPVGYQTPSPQYSYGTGPSNAKTQDYYNPITDKGTINR